MENVPFISKTVIQYWRISARLADKLEQNQNKRKRNILNFLLTKFQNITYIHTLIPNGCFKSYTTRCVMVRSY